MPTEYHLTQHKMTPEWQVGKLVEHYGIYYTWKISERTAIRESRKFGPSLCMVLEAFDVARPFNQPAKSIRRQVYRLGRVFNPQKLSSFTEEESRQLAFLNEKGQPL